MCCISHGVVFKVCMALALEMFDSLATLLLIAFLNVLLYFYMTAFPFVIALAVLFSEK